MIQTCYLKKIKAATRNEQFFVFSSPAVDPNASLTPNSQAAAINFIADRRLKAISPIDDANLLWHKTRKGRKGEWDSL
jgi:hypothetical protein